VKTRRLAGLFLATSSTLIFEIYLASQFVISTGHHFASIVVSTAMLGIGTAGVALRIFPKLSEIVSLSTLALLLAASYPVSLATAWSVSFDPVLIDWDIRQVFHLTLYYPVFAVPFFLSAMLVTVMMKEGHRFSGKIYFADMAGAATGGLMFFAVSHFLKTPPLTSIFMALAGAFFLRETDCRISTRVFVILAVTLLCVPFLELPLSEYKALSNFLKFPRTKVVASFRGPEGRVDVIESPFLRHAPGLNPAFTKPVPPATGIFLNGDLYSALHTPNDDYFLQLPASLPFRYKKPRRVLIVGAGGAAEWHMAKMASGTAATIVEGKRPIAEWVNRAAKTPYDVVNVPPRKFLLHRAKYDLISIPLPAIGRGVGTGVLSENYFLTSRFVSLCLDRLEEGGLLVSTLPLLPPPRAEPRLFRLFAEAVPDGWLKTAAFRSWGTFTVILQPSGFTKKQIGILKKEADELSLDPVWYPGITEKETNRKNRFSRPIYFETIKSMKNGDDTVFNTSPPSDDSPFFGNYLKFSRIPETVRIFEGRKLPVLTGGGMDLLIILQGGIFAFLLMALPLAATEKSRPPLLWLTYFFLLGSGYMLAEIVFIQKGILVLGEAVTSAAFVIPLMLAASAMGGWSTRKFSFGWEKPASVFAVLIAIGLFLKSSPDYFASGMALTAALFLAAVGCAGFVMGMPYPLGLRRAGADSAETVPWGMAANGFASVLGAASAPLFAYLIGFSGVFFLAAILYLAASGTAVLLNR